MRVEEWADDRQRSEGRSLAEIIVAAIQQVRRDTRTERDREWREAFTRAGECGVKLPAPPVRGDCDRCVPLRILMGGA